MNTDKASTRQVEYVVTLLTERLATFGGTIQEAVEKLHLDALTKKEAHTIIERLMAMPVDADPSLPALVASAPRHGVNGSAGPCASCKNVVEAGKGFYYGTKGAWSVHHKQGECGAVQAAAPAPADVVAGIYVHDDGKVSKLYMTGNQRLAGKALTPSGKYMYQQGLAMIVRQAVAMGTAHLISADEASAYGYRTSTCIECGLDLTDPRSDPKKGGAGYGPVCARKYGWPWGQVKVMS